MKRITLLTGYGLFFSQTRKSLVSIDTPKFIRLLQDRGLEVEHLEFPQLATRIASLTGRTLFYPLVFKTVSGTIAKGVWAWF